MNRKLKSRRGETLVETMAAVLVIGLASAVFLTMTTSASRINRQAALRDGNFYGDLAYAESDGSVTVPDRDDVPSQQKTVTVAYGEEADQTDSVSVILSGDDEQYYLYSYRLKTGEGGT